MRNFDNAEYILKFLCILLTGCVLRCAGMCKMQGLSVSSGIIKGDRGMPHANRSLILSLFATYLCHLIHRTSTAADSGAISIFRMPLTTLYTVRGYARNPCCPVRNRSFMCASSGTPA